VLPRLPLREVPRRAGAELLELIAHDPEHGPAKAFCLLFRDRARPLEWGESRFIENLVRQAVADSGKRPRIGEQRLEFARVGPKRAPQSLERQLTARGIGPGASLAIGCGYASMAIKPGAGLERKAGVA